MSRLIALHDADAEHFGRLNKFPNYALMKISAWHKQQGDEVVWFSPIEAQFYDLVYSSKIFDFVPENPYLPENTIKGGTVKEADLDSIAFELRADSDMCQAVVKNYDLFKIKGGKVTSDRVQRNLKKRAEISEARKSAAEARWNSSEAPRNASGEASEGSAPFSQPSEEIAPCGAGGFLGADEKRSHAETVKWYKEWFAERFEKFTEEALKEDDFDAHPVWGVNGVFMNIVDEVSQYPTLKIAKKSVKTTEFLGVMRHFVWSRQHLEELADVIREVNEKADQGRIKNKQNYLIAALYQAARVNGGSAD